MNKIKHDKIKKLTKSLFVKNCQKGLCVDQGITSPSLQEARKPKLKDKIQPTCKKLN